MNLQGKRKFLLGLAYLIINGGLALAVVLFAPASELLSALSGLAGFSTSQSIGMGAIIYGNVKEHEHKNGKSGEPGSQG